MSIPVARGYCRVSTSMQLDGVSLETQHKRIQAHCDYKGLNLIKCYEERGVSGKNIERPALQSLLSDLNKGEYVIVADLSRLSRNTRDALGLFETFKSRGVHFVCLSPDIDFSTPVGELLFTVMMAVHRLERQNISMHVSNNMQRLSKEGKLRSRAPFGYKFVGKDRDLEPEPTQQAVIEKIKTLHAANMKLAQIAKQLNAHGDNLTLLNNKKTVPGDKVPVFYAQTIKRILQDQGLVTLAKPNERVTLEQRITSHHKSADVNGLIQVTENLTLNPPTFNILSTLIQK